MCIGCAARLEWPLCGDCRSSLRDGPRFILDGEVLVRTGYHHHAAARRLVHRLKYDGLQAAAHVLGAAMASLVPSGASALIPVPRAITRRMRFGIDPAHELAAVLAGACKVPVIGALRPSLWWPRLATRVGADRRPARFRAVTKVPPGAVLVDDVVTSGATIRAARDALARTQCGDVHFAVAATSPGTIDQHVDTGGHEDRGLRAHSRGRRTT